jgi:hypothetical protein
MLVPKDRLTCQGRQKRRPDYGPPRLALVSFAFSLSGVGQVRGSQPTCRLSD